MHPSLVSHTPSTHHARNCCRTPVQLSLFTFWRNDCTEQLCLFSHSCMPYQRFQKWCSEPQLTGIFPSYHVTVLVSFCTLLGSRVESSTQGSCPLQSRVCRQLNYLGTASLFRVVVVSVVAVASVAVVASIAVVNPKHKLKPQSCFPFWQEPFWDSLLW